MASHEPLNAHSAASGSAVARGAGTRGTDRRAAARVSVNRPALFSPSDGEGLLHQGTLADVSLTGVRLRTRCPWQTGVELDIELARPGCPSCAQPFADTLFLRGRVVHVTSCVNQEWDMGVALYAAPQTRPWDVHGPAQVRGAEAEPAGSDGLAAPEQVEALPGKRRKWPYAAACLLALLLLLLGGALRHTAGHSAGAPYASLDGFLEGEGDVADPFVAPVAPGPGEDPEYAMPRPSATALRLAVLSERLPGPGAWPPAQEGMREGTEGPPKRPGDPGQPVFASFHPGTDPLTRALAGIPAVVPRDSRPGGPSPETPQDPSGDTPPPPEADGQPPELNGMGGPEIGLDDGAYETYEAGEPRDRRGFSPGQQGQDLWVEIDKSDFTLTVRRGQRVMRVYPVGLGKGGTTPEGDFRVSTKLTDPAWYHNGRSVEPEDPRNPLGKRWIGLSADGPGGPRNVPIGIHATDQASSVGRAASKGCIRMRPEDVETVFRVCPVGTHIKICP